MEQKTDNEKLLIPYLLGELSEEEESRIEELYFNDPDSLEELLAVEEELIDNYVRGELARSRREQFEKKILKSAVLGEKVEFARALMKHVSEPSTVGALAPASWRRLPSALLSNQKHAAVAVAAVVLLMVGCGSLLVAENLRLRNLLEQKEEQRVILEQRKEELQKLVTEQQASSGKLVEDFKQVQSQLAKAEEELARQKDAQMHNPETVSKTEESRAIIASHVFESPGLSRDSGSTVSLTIPSRPGLVRLQLDLKEDIYIKFYAGISRVEPGGAGWGQMNLRAQTIGSKKAVVLLVPSKYFTEGDYVLTLTGVTRDRSDRTWEAGQYYFRVVIK